MKKCLLCKKNHLLILFLVMISLVGCSENNHVMPTGEVKVSEWENRFVIYYDALLYFSNKETTITDEIIISNDNNKYIGVSIKEENPQMLTGNLISYNIPDNCRVYYNSEVEKIYVRIDKNRWVIMIPRIVPFS